MKKGHIYKITSQSGKIYIGKSMNIKNRFRQYKGMRCKSQPALYNSFIKYGVDSHNFEIIGEFYESELSDMEIYFISKFNSMCVGLNCTKGGDGGFMTGEYNVAKRNDVRLKMSNAKKEYYSSGRKNPLLGSTRSDETKNKLKQKRAEQEESGKSIRHLMVLDTLTGIYYRSIKDASESTNIKYKSFFSRIRYSKQTRYKLV